MEAALNMDPTSFLDRDSEPRVCMLTSSDFQYRCHLEDFEFSQPGRIKSSDLMSFFDDDDMHFNEPSPLQSFAWSSLFYSPVKSLIMQVRNSSLEKPLAFILPLVVLVDPAIQYTQAICVVPNHEVGKKVLDLVQKHGKHASITSGLFQDFFASTRKETKKLPQVVIGTADAILLMFTFKYLDNPPLKIIVFNDLDQILRRNKNADGKYIGIGFGIPRSIMELVSKECQVVLISSSINDNVKDFSQMIKAGRSYDWLFGNSQELALFSAKHYKIILKDDVDKGEFIRVNHLGHVNEQLIIYVNKGEAREMKDKVRSSGTNILGFRHQITYSENGEGYNIDSFKVGDDAFLITSHSLDRRVESIKEVSLVIHAALPMGDYMVDYKEWFLRSSQAGHLGCSGVVLHLIQGYTEMRDMQLIERYFERQIPELSQDADFEDLCDKHGIEYDHRITKRGRKEPIRYR